MDLPPRFPYERSRDVRQCAKIWVSLARQARQAAAYQSLTHSLQVSREAERLRQAQQGRRRAQGEA